MHFVTWAFCQNSMLFTVFIVLDHSIALVSCIDIFIVSPKIMHFNLGQCFASVSK